MFSRKGIVFVVALTVALSALTISPPPAEIAAPKAENERKLRVNRFQRMPVKVTLVKNLQSETWYKDLEIQVKNVSGKPIYCILASLTFADDYSDRSKVGLISLKFGLQKYLDIQVVGNPLDSHLKPGESCVLRIHEDYWSLIRRKQERFPERFRSFVTSFGVINFGDETGFTSVSGWADYRANKHKVRHHRERFPIIWDRR